MRRFGKQAWIWIAVSMLMVLAATVSTVVADEEAQEKFWRTEYIHVGPNWAALHNLKPSEKTFRVRVKGDDEFKVGESLAYRVKSKQSGRLWMVQVDPKDQVTLLVPNPKMKDNRIEADQWFQIPPEGATWHVVAGEPVGKSVVVFIVTEGDTDLADALGLEKSMDKALRLVENDPSWGLEKWVIDVKSK